MKNKILVFALSLALMLSLIFFIKAEVYGAETQSTGYLDAQLEMLDFGEINAVIGSSDTAYDINFLDVVKKAISGELDLSVSGIINGILQIVFNEVFANISILKNLIILCILSALLKNLTDSFKNKSVGEIGFYISYIALVMVLFSSFRSAAGILEDFILTITTFITALVPVITTLLVMGGNVTGGYIFASILYFAAGFLMALIKNVFIPLILITATLQIVNYLTENNTLKNLSELIKKIITWAIKGTAVIFMSIITIQKISSPILNNLALKTAKTTIGVVPVVGEILTGAVDTVMVWMQACKSGVLVAILLAVAAFCIIPVLKLVAFIFIYKLTAALIQPICDKRIVNCIDVIGDYTSLMLSCAVIITVMVVSSVMIMLSF